MEVGIKIRKLFLLPHLRVSKGVFMRKPGTKFEEFSNDSQLQCGKPSAGIIDGILCAFPLHIITVSQPDPD